MKSIFLLALAAVCTYLGYKTISIYLTLNNGRIGFRWTEPMDWVLYIMLIICFGLAWHALLGLFQKKRST